VAHSLLVLGRLKEKRGDQGSARSHYDEALQLGRDTQEPTLVLLATAYRSLLPGGDADEAIAALESEMHVGYGQRLNARFLLWQATRDPAHLKEAHRLLVHTRDHAPEECRDSMIENVPIHANIMKAWEEHGEKG